MNKPNLWLFRVEYRALTFCEGGEDDRFYQNSVCSPWRFLLPWSAVEIRIQSLLTTGPPGLAARFARCDLIWLQMLSSSCH
jgi:hypothetical protein